MGNFIPRKYNTNLIIGLSVAVVIAAVVIAYLYYRKSPQPQPSQHHPQHPSQHHPQGARPQPPATDTRVDVADTPTLVLYWAKWCPYSTKMIPEWEKAVSILNADGSGFKAVDFEESRDGAEVSNARQTYGSEFRGYPHIRLFPEGYSQGKPSIAFNGNVGDRTEEGLVKFAYSNAK